MSRGRFLLSFSLAVLLVALATLNLMPQVGALAMIGKRLSLGWEWRADRPLTQLAAIRIERLKREKSGLFGIANSPSLSNSLPEPISIDALIIAVDRIGPAESGHRLKFRAPKMELKEAKEGDIVAIGIIGQAAVCLTERSVESNGKDVSAWLREVRC